MRKKRIDKVRAASEHLLGVWVAMLVDRKALSAIFGLSSISRLIASGLPVASGGGRGVTQMFDTVAVHKWLTDRALTKAGLVGERPDWAEECRKKRARALDREHELAMGRLVAVSEVSDAATDFVRRLREATGHTISAWSRHFHEAALPLLDAGQTDTHRLAMQKATTGLQHELWDILAALGKRLTEPDE